MLKRILLVAALAVSGLTLVAKAAESPAQLFTDVSQSLARLEFTYANDIVGSQKRGGQAICVDEAKGIFITFDVPSGVPAEELKDFTLTSPGTSGTSIKADFIGVDPEQGLGFIQAAEKHGFKAAKLDLAPVLEVGQDVYSVGLLGVQMGSSPYLGAAKISAGLRTPGRICMVTGGDLCIVSSPVFNSEGKVIGLIAQQLVMEYRLRTNEGQADVGLTGTQSTRFFTPMSEFASQLNPLPTKGNMRKLPWLGVFQLKSPPPTEADVLGLAGKGAVMVGQLLPGGVGEKAGLKQGDPNIAVNGKPVEMLSTPELTEAAFIQKLWQFKPGDKVTFTIFRDKAAKDISLTLEPFPATEAKRYYNQKLGLAVRELTLFDRYGSGRTMPMETQGVLVLVAAQGSPSAKAGLKAGDLVTQLNDKPVTNAADIENLIKAAGKNDLKFQVIRGDKPEIVVIRP